MAGTFKSAFSPLACSLLAASALTSGCAGNGLQPVRVAQPKHMTVAICETVATDTRCFRHNAAAFADDLELYREMMEMDETERLSDQ